MTRLLCGWGLLAIVLGLATASAAEPAKPDVVISAAALMKEVSADSKAAAAKYQGKVLEVTGGLQEAVGTRYRHPKAISLAGGKAKPAESGEMSVSVILVDELVEAGKSLAMGQKIKVVGKLLRVKDDTVVLENGTFVELEKNPIPTVTAAELLGAYAKDEKAAGKKYGTWDAKKELFLKATAREIGERDARFDVKLLTLEPQGGKLKLRVSVAADDVEGLKPGDPILVKVLCTGMGFAAREGELVCSQAVVLKPDAKPSAKGK